MADSDDLVAIILSALESISASELCLLSKLLASESSLQLHRLWILMASPSLSLSIISFLETLSQHHRRLLLARVTLRLVCRITNFLEELAACGSDQEALDGTNPLRADLTHHSHQCAGESFANSLPLELDIKSVSAVVRETMDSTIGNPMYADMVNQQLPFADVSSANAVVDVSLEDVENSEKEDKAAVMEGLSSVVKPGVDIADARLQDVDSEDPCLAGSDVTNPRHACAGPGNINIAGLDITNSNPRCACAGPGNIDIGCADNVTNLGAQTENPSMEPSRMKGMSVDIANSRFVRVCACAGSSNPRFTGMDLCMDVLPPSYCEDVKDDVALPWGETDAAFLFLFLWEMQEQECQEAMQRWSIDPYIYHLLVVQDMDVLGDAKSKSAVIRAPKWRERLQKSLRQNVLQVGYGFPGTMVSTNFPASLSAYIDTIGRFQRILRSMSAEESSEQRPPPASAATLHSLPTLIIGMSSEEKGKVCIICKEELEPSSVASQLPCLHVYHWDCILSWLKQRNNCPVCRHELPTDDCDYELQRKIQILKERVS